MFNKSCYYRKCRLLNRSKNFKIMETPIEKTNNKLGHLFVLASALFPALTYADMMIMYGKGIMLTLSVIIAIALVCGAIVLLNQKKISTWLMWIIVASVCAQLVCNFVMFCSYGYSYSEFLGQDMFYADTTTMNITLTISCIIFALTYIVYYQYLKKKA